MSDRTKLSAVSIVFLSLFLIGAGIRAVNIWQPIDTTSWRESDVGSIARNYYRESMNLFEPRIDWRGDGPGYTESEFPIYPWTIALLYKLFGYHESFGRVLSYFFSLVALFFFIKLTRHLLPLNGAIAAIIFFVLSPLAANISTSLQPDGLMFMFYVLCVYCFVRWIDDGSDKHYAFALIATMFALLAKLPAAHIGLLIAFLLFTRKGWSSLKDWRVWLFGAATLLPSVLWYAYAKHLWLTYGNSLGVSNEQHWAGLALLHNKELIKGIARIELTYVLPPAGLLLIVFALFYQLKNRTLHICLFWLAAIAIYYLLAANTTSSDWASYYHVVSVPPVALLLGLAISSINVERFSAAPAWQKVVSVLTVICFAAVLALEAKTLKEILVWQRSDLRDCATSFAPKIPQGALIVASGGDCRGNYGQRVAYNSSYMFYWLDRKGFNTCREEQSIEKINEMVHRGAKYFIAEKSSLAVKSNFEAELRRNFTLKAECQGAYLFELNVGHKSILPDAQVQQAMVDYFRGQDVSKAKITMPPLKFGLIPEK